MAMLNEVRKHQYWALREGSLGMTLGEYVLEEHKAFGYFEPETPDHELSCSKLPYSVCLNIWNLCLL